MRINWKLLSFVLIATTIVTSTILVANQLGMPLAGTSPVAEAHLATPHNTVHSESVIDNTLTAADLAANSVGASEIAANAVGASQIAAGAIGSSEIADNAVGSGEIAASAVGASEIAVDSVGPGEIIGVERLSFVDCGYSAPLTNAGGTFAFSCAARGAQIGDNVVATNNSSSCMVVSVGFVSLAGTVGIHLRNACSSAVGAHMGMASVVLFHQ